MNTSDSLIRLTDFAENTMARLPVALCLDTSGSMAGEPLAELNRGLATFFDCVRQHPVACRSAEMSLTAFDDDAQLLLDFTPFRRLPEPPQIDSAQGCTNLAGGVGVALDAIHRCRKDYRAAGIDFYKPFLVLMSDGAPNIGDHEAAARRVREMEEKRQAVVFPIAIGPEADLAVLGTFSARGALRLKGLNFAEFFKWLSTSLGVISTSRVGDTVSLPKDNIDKWMEF